MQFTNWLRYFRLFIVLNTIILVWSSAACCRCSDAPPNDEVDTSEKAAVNEIAEYFRGRNHSFLEKQEYCDAMVKEAKINEKLVVQILAKSMETPTDIDFIVWVYALEESSRSKVSVKKYIQKLESEFDDVNTPADSRKAISKNLYYLTRDRKYLVSELEEYLAVTAENQKKRIEASLTGNFTKSIIPDIISIIIETHNNLVRRQCYDALRILTSNISENVPVYTEPNSEEEERKSEIEHLKKWWDQIRPQHDAYLLKMQKTVFHQKITINKVMSSDKDQGKTSSDVENPARK